MRESMDCNSHNLACSSREVRPPLKPYLFVMGDSLSKLIRWNVISSGDLNEQLGFKMYI